LKTINWITGGTISDNWAYGNNARNLISKLPNYEHGLDNNKDSYDIVVFFDILLFHRYYNNFPKSKKILRLGGIRPFERLKKQNVNSDELGNKADIIVSVSEHLLENINTKTQKVTIFNGVNLDLFNSNNYIKPNTFVIGFSGNISNEEQKEFKGYNIVNDFCSSYDVPYLIASKGKREILNREMKARFYNNISCLLHPSIYEGCSNTISEALACGVPVISTAKHSDKLIQGHNIVICERTIESIVECVKYVKNNWENLSKNGQEFIKQNQDLNLIAKQWEEIIGKL
jgi:glycosyltransferase involved in cell wall biosynthesis